MNPENARVLYGGADPVNFMEGTRSLGELCIKQLTDRCDAVALVSLFFE